MGETNYGKCECLSVKWGFRKFHISLKTTESYRKTLQTFSRFIFKFIKGFHFPKKERKGNYHSMFTSSNLKTETEKESVSGSKLNFFC
ncbi:hypothetical protein [Methanosarcina acetivorans]|nr:hypothetical protein [Methanosarcina acetivorans]